ncbi:malonyl-ACP O-methyltransferase BioC [Erwinia amylovora]|uniref:Malonyl-[acyl-carrier protein] O-methyltransferase n=4 Tax=Erwinia amylovora TaxID=552 RepID=A0A830ZUJ6_ERWAM|nr:malonyl-ACP O-methyltransferase BioC [Erwinia amylovora]CBX80062.1 Biotin synthesis protein bioC [Erwinia amylovora ATCC BAA-2158]CDK14749.1 Biotin synthesis protein bioC [Erwinia amylovora LA635]CDK18117.1 Biotin synthesis protein bioC [Erwinia amylovora LA636]CDK21486.1 Biotin synthesis protein bioC [Erwinia amylovora LA637]ATZ11077.1 malonyl-[acyl-carrier protein] O-methyltransferase BioC [Erwinia amylovora]
MQQTVNKQAIAAAFGRAARSYNQHAELQRQCGERLLQHARPGIALQVLDAGCGTGWFSRRWRADGHRVTALDLSEKMLQQARENQAADCYQSGDIEALPFADARFDRCWSNLAVQWCSDLSQALRELRRVTKPGGQVLFSTLTEGSLNEVSAAWQYLGRSAPLNRFASLPVIEQAAAGMMLASYTLTLAFPDVQSALRSLKGIGATHLHQGRPDSMLSRRELQRLEQVWQRDARGCLLSYQLVSGVIECE